MAAPAAGSPTSTRDVIAHYPHPINTVSVDSTGEFAALGGKKGLHIVRLDFPKDPIKSIPQQQSKWEVSCVEWNPHNVYANYVAATVNQETLIWRLDEAGPGLHTTIKGHQRSITDVAWSLFEPQVIATSSIDTNVNVWDTRDPAKPLKLRSLFAHAGVSQVKWNRFHNNVLASAQGGEVRIWDLRESVYSFRAHVAEINGLDWSYTNEHELATCSQETKVKVWNTSARNAPPIMTLQTVAPVLRSRFTTFGKGFVTVAQKGDLSIRLWSIVKPSFPTVAHVYNGHTDLVRAVDFRTIRGSGGTQSFQLVSWSKDQTLRLWCIDDETLQACGYNPAQRSPVVTRHLSTPPAASSSMHIRRASEGIPTLAGSGSAKSASNIISPPRAPFITLEQEFQLCERSLGSGLEKVNLVDRTCVLVTRNDSLKQAVVVKVSFPAMYPMNATPAFEFAPRTTIPLELQAQVKELLRETAAKQVEASQPCLERIAKVLQTFVAEELSDLLGEAPTEQNPSTLIAENLPSPRLTGAVFSPKGKLVLFSNFAKKLPASVRTMEDFLSHDKGELGPSQSPFFSIPDIFYGQGWGVEDNAQIGKLLRKSTRSPSVTGGTHYRIQEESLSLQDEDEDDEGLNELKTPLDIRGSVGFKGPTTRGPSPTPSRQKRNKTVVNMLDLAAHMSIDRNLGSAFVVQGSVDDVCQRNARFAAEAGRDDLAQLWSLLGLVASPAVCRTGEEADPFETPWACHPFGRDMVASLFQHYARLRDVQTLALMSCVLLGHKPRAYEGMTRSRTGENLLAAESRRSLLDSSRGTLYNNFRRIYAEILYQWQEREKSAEVAKYIDQATTEHRGIEFGALCRWCLKPSPGSHCDSCKKYAFYCSVCQLPVRGLSSFCMFCGHGGHTVHLQSWFKSSPLCASGCGCRCLEMDVSLLATVMPSTNG